MPLAWRFQRCGESAHHGLVVWNIGDDRPYRARIGVQPGPNDLEDAFPFVPKDRRAAHAHAVRKLRALGAKVDTWWHHCGYRRRSTRDAQRSGDQTPYNRHYWRTVVYLPRQWQGGDDGLIHLQDLYHLRDLYLIQCDVTDRGLQHVGELSGLEVLFLVETRATDAGLVHLQELKELVACRLEGTAEGREFTDAGLPHLKGLSELQDLTLYGEGFTDTGWKLLQDEFRLLELELLDTAITKQNGHGTVRRQ